MKKAKNNFFSNIWHSDRIIISILFFISAFFAGFTSFRMLYIQHKVFAAFCAGIACVAVVFVAFYFLIKRLGGTAGAAKAIRKQKVVFISVLIAFVISFFVFAVYTLSPFGDYTVLRMDLYHQYGPLYAELYDKVADGKSLFYSWNSAGGSGFLGNYFNYLSSPFTLLIFWFSKTEVVTTAISVIIFTKCIFSAATFSYYLKKRFSENSMLIPAFAVLYAFSAYFVAYYWNLMWLDAVLIFPLVLLGIERIIDHSGGKLYFVCLIYAFLTNYYEAYMICIFSVIYFLYYYLSNYKLNALYVPKTPDLPRFSHLRQSRFLCSGLRFAFYSVLAALCCSVILIPLYKILTNSSATGDSFPSEFKTYFDIYDFLVSHLAFLEPTIRSSGGDVTPNIYCGILSIILFPLFIMSKRFSWKDKTATILLLIVLFFCFNTNIANYIWHGFHFPNDLPYRFSFMYSFIVLICAYKVVRYIRDFNYKTIVLLSGILIFVCICAQKFDFRYADSATIYISIAFIILYTLIICASISKKLSAALTSVVICCGVMCEVLICDVPKFEFGVRESDYVSDYEAYRKELEFIAEKDNGFYRTEINDHPTQLRMSPCWYNYEGINCFSSMANESVANMQYKLGNFSNKINSFMYHNQTPIYNFMFNIKYVIDNNNPIQLNDNYYQYLRGSREKLTTYENKYPSSIAFCANNSLARAWSTADNDNCFENQESFIKLASGVDKEFFERVKLYTNGAQNCSITSFENEGDGSMSFSVFDSENSADFQMNFTADEEGEYFLFLGSLRDFEKAEIDIENIRIEQEIDTEPYILDLGKLAAGQEVNIKTYIKEEVGSGNANVWAYRFNDEAFTEAYQKLADEGMLKVEQQTDTYIKGTVKAEKDEFLYTSISYESGWRCYVDGTPVKANKINDALLALNVGEGEHTVEFKYIPAGLKTGGIISGITVLAIIIVFIIKKAVIYFIKKATDQMLSHEA